MIAKQYAPHLNRAQRRDKSKGSINLGKGGMTWLLYGLLRRGGYMAGEEVPPRPENAATAPKQGFLSRLKSRFRSLLGL